MRKPTTILILMAMLLAMHIGAQERAICAVCGPREGAGLEPVKATATYRGKHLYFCSLKCKIEFLKNPEEFLTTDAGKDAPSFVLNTFDGKALSLDDYRGKVVLLDFWATFCPPCIKALPELQRLHQTHSQEGFSVIGVTVDDRAALVRKAIAGAKVTYPILKASPDVWNAYKVSALPALILVGRDGRIIRRYGGEADKQAMVADIERALAVTDSITR